MWLLNGNIAFPLEETADRRVPFGVVATIASPLAPASIDWKTRARRPLAGAVVALLAIDAIGLGLHLADAANPVSRAQTQPRVQARTTVTAPNAVVNGETIESAAGTTKTTTPTRAFIGPVAPPVVTTPPPSNSGTPAPTPTPATPVPLLQTAVGVPALGVNAQVGLGDGSCTSVNLTVIALGSCPTPQSDGAVVLQLGGSLLGN